MSLLQIYGISVAIVAAILAYKAERKGDISNSSRYISIIYMGIGIASIGQF
jgi:hypothetical protein